MTNIIAPFTTDANGKRTFNSIPFYLDWANDWLTITAMAEYYSIKESYCNTLIDAGRIANSPELQQAIQDFKNKI